MRKRAAQHEQRVANALVTKNAGPLRKKKKKKRVLKKKMGKETREKQKKIRSLKKKK